MLERLGQRVRLAVFKRGADRCEYCQTPARYSADPLAVEHIIPRSRGGKSTLENLCVSCQGCNNHKYTRVAARDPVTDRQVPLFNPRTSSWTEHFAWSPNATAVIALSAIGRATIEVLRLNRPGLVGLREALIAIGEHPPLA